jgi:arylsulfatase A-like enzyme
MKTEGLTRRDFLKRSTATSILAMPAINVNALAGPLDSPECPNIVFFMADDLGYADLGCYGQRGIETPNIDRLAAEGMRYTQCYAGAAVCAPSRSVLMTGQHTGHTTVRNNRGDNTPKHNGQDGRIPLRKEDVTVAQVLKQAGYATAITGKWGLGEPGSTGLPNDHGFDEWLGYLNQDHAPFYFTDYLWRNKERQAIAENEDGKRGVYSCDLFSRFSLDFIRKNQTSPFFLYVPTTIPHKNFEVPDLGVYADKPWSEEAKIFAAMVTRMDAHVGQIMALLKELDLDKKTVFFFTSDNGSAKGWEGVFDSCGPLRAKKSSLYEGGLRVPMIVRWPGKIPAGTVSDAVWYFADVLPTMAALAGTQAPDGIDGIAASSILPDPTKSLPDRFLYWEVRRHDPQQLEQAVRWGNWKALRHDAGEPLELYDLVADVGEKNNIAKQHPEVVARIEDYLKNARTASPHWPLVSETSSSQR